MTEPLDLEPIKARLAALAICDGPIFPKADWQAEMEALVAEVERLRGALEEVSTCGWDGGYASEVANAALAGRPLPPD